MTKSPKKKRAYPGHKDSATPAGASNARIVKSSDEVNASIDDFLSSMAPEKSAQIRRLRGSLNGRGILKTLMAERKRERHDE